MKKLAEELNIPIIITSQLSKEPDIRVKAGQDPRPKLEDFKYSAEIIKDADMIMLLYRDDYYYPDSEMADTIDSKSIVFEQYSVLHKTQIQGGEHYAFKVDIIKF